MSDENEYREREIKRTQTRIKAAANDPKAKIPPPIDPNNPPAGLMDRDTALRIMAKKMVPLALRTLKDVMTSSKHDPARLGAAKEVLERAYGKSARAYEQPPPNNSKIEVVFGKKQPVEVIVDETAGREGE